MIGSFGQKMYTAFVVGQRSQVEQNPFERTDSAINRGFVVGNQGAQYNYFPEYRVNGVVAQDIDWKDNLAIVTGVNGTEAPAGLILGLGSPGFAPFNGPLAEIIFYDRVLTNEEIIAVEQYLAAKWKVEIATK